MSKEILVEKVPRARVRAGDVLLSGPNNSSIILGRDRDGGVDSGYGSGPGAGALTLVVGRKGEDPRISEDSSTIYISSKSDPDAYAGTDVGSAQKGAPSLIAASDCVRIVARVDLKIVVGRASLVVSQDGSVVIEGDVKIGERAMERALKGDSFLKHYATHSHPVVTTPAGMVAGPLTPALTPPAMEALLSPRLKMT
jgi:hypothetical protein